DHIGNDHISDDHINCDATSDLRLGAFREDGPWVVDPPTMAWRHNIERIRAATHSEVPRLLRARRVPPGRRVVAVAGRVGLALGDETPLAAASIAQVHAATLLTGEHVVVKVQRPSVERLVRRDLAAMAWLAPLLVGRIPVSALANPPALVELFAETIVEELD